MHAYEYTIQKLLLGVVLASCILFPIIGCDNAADNATNAQPSNRVDTDRDRGRGLNLNQLEKPAEVEVFFV